MGGYTKSTHQMLEIKHIYTMLMHIYTIHCIL